MFRIPRMSFYLLVGAIVFVIGGFLYYNYLSLNTFVIHNQMENPLTDVNVILPSGLIWVGSIASDQKKKIYSIVKEDGAITIEYTIDDQRYINIGGYVAPYANLKHKIIVNPEFIEESTSK